MPFNTPKHMLASRLTQCLWPFSALFNLCPTKNFSISWAFLSQSWCPIVLSCFLLPLSLTPSLNLHSYLHLPWSLPVPCLHLCPPPSLSSHSSGQSAGHVSVLLSFTAMDASRGLRLYFSSCLQ